MTGDDDEANRDDRIYRMRLLGFSPRTIAEKLGIAVTDVHLATDARMPKVTNEYRARAFALDLDRLELLTTKCLEAISKGSLAAGHLLLKVLERRAYMLGTDAPLRIDPIELVAKPETSTENLRRVFNEMRREHLAEQPPPLPN